MSNNAPLPLSEEGYCERCDGMFSAAGFEKMRSLEGYFHSKKPGTKQAAEQGCMLCREIFPMLTYAAHESALTFYVNSDRTGDKDAWHAWRKAIFSPSEDAAKCLVGGMAPVDGPETLLALDDLGLGAKSRDYRVEIGLVAEEGDPLALYFPARPLETRVSSPHVIEKANEWFKECRESHSACVKHHGEHSFVPRRVLEVGDSSATVVCLRDMSAAEDCAYAALSYCWGGPQPTVTTVANLKEHMVEGISIGDLPPTLRDAISVTQSLGMQYLWVDALCIVQDDDVDKMKEVENMGKVYRTAAITICASVSESVSHGFLNVPREQPKVHRKRLHLSDETRGDIGWAIVDTVIERDSHPLDGRAWAMQESLLSPRRLLYSTYELVWDCNTTGLRTRTTSQVKYSLTTSQDAQKLFGGASGGSTTPQKRSATWRSLVSDYSRRELTLATDRLPAMLGIAGEVCAAWGDSHLFGLLRSDLITQLAWKAEFPTRSTPSDRPPSWSCVSTDLGWIAFIYGDAVEPDARFVDVDADDPTRLLLEARLAEVDASKFPMVQSAQFEYGDEVEYKEEDEDEEEDKAEDKEEDKEEDDVEEEDGNLYLDVTTDYSHVESDRILLLGRGCLDSRIKVPSDLGLIVREVEAGTYRRLGFISFDPDLAGYDHNIWEKYERQTVVLI